MTLKPFFSLSGASRARETQRRWHWQSSTEIFSGFVLSSTFSNMLFHQLEFSSSLSGWHFADCNLIIHIISYSQTLSPQVDEFLGQLSLPLREFDVYERPRSKYAAGEFIAFGHMKRDFDEDGDIICYWDRREFIVFRTWKRFWWVGEGCICYLGLFG